MKLTPATPSDLVGPTRGNSRRDTMGNQRAFAMTPHPNASGVGPRCCRKRKTGLATLLLIACNGCSPQLNVSKETTYFTAPLHPDGRVNYAEALNELYGSGVTPENNAAVPLLAVLDDTVPEPVAERLGLRHAPQPNERFLGGFAYWSKYIEWRREGGHPLPGTSETVGDQFTADLLAAIERPWSPRDHPLVAGWLEDMKRPLEAVDRATTRPRYWIPATDLPTSHLPNLLKSRNVATALRARTMLRLSEGDPDGASRDVLTILRFASLESQGSTLINQLSAVAIAGIGAESLPLVAAHPKLSEDALRRALSELEGIEPLRSPAEKIGNGERAHVLDAAMQIAFRGKYSPGENDIGLWGMDRNLVDWDEVLKTINQCYDTEIACHEAPTVEARRAACDERDRLLPKDLVAEVLKSSDFPTATALLFFKTSVSIQFSSFGGSYVVFNEQNTLDRLARFSLIARAYRREKGQFPDGLASLSASELHGVSVAASQHGYRFAFHSGAGSGYAYTAVPEEQGQSGRRSFCVDGTGKLVILEKGVGPEVRGAQCASASAK